METQSIVNWGPRSISYWLILPVALGIIFIGFRFIIDPVTASQGYGIPLQQNPSLSYGYIKGIRDIFSGLVLLALMSRRDARMTAIIFSIAIIIPLGDFCIILARNGSQDITHLFIHGGTAVYMIVVSVMLYRITSKTKKIYNE